MSSSPSPFAAPTVCGMSKLSVPASGEAPHSFIPSRSQILEIVAKFARNLPGCFVGTACQRAEPDVCVTNCYRLAQLPTPAGP